MQTVIQLSKSNKIKGDEYMNYDDNQTLLDKEGADIYAKRYEGKFKIQSDNFVSLDSDAVSWLNSKLLKADVYRVFLMANTLKWEWSVICDDKGKPLVAKELAKILKMSLNKFYEMARKLENHNIMLQATCPLFGETKVYMMNPFIARKTMQLDNYLLTKFNDVLMRDKVQK